MLIGAAASSRLPATVDLDRDGVSDVWRSTHLGAGPAAADPDGDGADNRAESLAGTDPRSAASHLSARGESDPTGRLSLRWPAQRGKRYRLEASPDLATWTVQGDPLDATADADLERVVRTAGAAAPAREFWRVAVEDRDTDADGYTDWEEYQFGGDPLTAQIPLRAPFYVFANCMSGHTAAEIIARCQAHGYNGVVTDGFSPEFLQQFAEHPEVVSGRFRLHAAYWWNQLAKSIDENFINRSLDQARRMGTEIWMTLEATDTTANRALGMERYKLMARLCQAKGVQFVVYPHDGCIWETAAEGKQIVADLAAAGYPGVKITFGLYHELCDGQGGKLDDTAAAVQAATSTVVIYGTNTASPWNILPLGEGTYDIGPFLRILDRRGYTQPVALLTWGLPSPSPTDPNAHLARSMRKWRQSIAAPSSP